MQRATSVDMVDGSVPLVPGVGKRAPEGVPGQSNVPRVVALLALGQCLTVGLAAAGSAMISSSFSDPSGLDLHNDDASDDYTGALRPVNMLGVAFLLYGVPAGISVLWWGLEELHRLRSGPGLPAAVTAVVGLEAVVLAFVALLRLGQPQNTFAADRDPLQQFIGGWLFAAALPLGVACLVVAWWSGRRTASALLGAPGRLAALAPAFPSSLAANAWPAAGALVLIPALLAATGCFSSVWNFSAGSYFPATSPYALNPASWSIGTGPHAFVFKLYPDAVLYYVYLLALTVGGLATYVVPSWRALLHRRLGGGSAASARASCATPWAHPALWGITVGEVLTLAATAALYVVWFVYWGFLFTHIQHEVEGSQHSQVQRWARVLGHMATLSFSLLMLPVARDSIWTGVFGISFERAVKYHRWLGALAYLSLTAHMAAWWVQWALIGKWAHNVTTTHDLVIALKDNGREWRHFDNFTMPFTHTAWALLTASLAVTIFMRRRSFDFFYNLHAYVGIVVLVTGAMHAWTYWYYAAGGLILYYLDRTWRFMRRTHSATAAVAPLPGARVTVVTLPASVLRTSLSTAGQHTAGQFAWVYCSALSDHAWHAFTLSASPSAAAASGEVTFHIKSMGPGTWSDALYMAAGGAALHSGPTVSVNTFSGSGMPGGGGGAAAAPLLAQTDLTWRAPSVPLLLTVDGPYGRPWDFTAYPRLALFAGGIGVTPMFAILSEVVHRARAAEAASPPPVSFVWCVREAGLLAEFGARLFDALGDTTPHVSVTFYNKAVGAPGALAGLPTGAADWILARTVDKRPAFLDAVRATGAAPADAAGAAGAPAPGLVLACGPPSLVDAASEAAAGTAWAFHHEEFSW